MPQSDIRCAAQAAAQIVSDAGGCVIGRTRLQKIAYLLELGGVGTGFPFEYRHYGPYSEVLALAIRAANRLGMAEEEERQTSWGGFFSIFRTHPDESVASLPGRRDLVVQAASSDSVELELAATAAFLFSQGERNPWDETARRKPEKARDRLEAAKALYARLRHIQLPRPLPDFD